MRMLAPAGLRAGLSVLLLANLIIPSRAYLSTKREFIIHSHSSVQPAPQSSGLRILGPDKKPNPVVNEANQINLTVVDANGQAVTDVTFESGSPDIASVDPKTGAVRGMQQGFATITARRANGDSVSTFVVVARVSRRRGVKVPGDIKIDTGGRIYISDPLGSVILRDASIFAGQKGVNGRKDGQRLDALFAGPTAVALENSALGGIYIADTLNHSLRKIGFNDQVTTVLGTGLPGKNSGDTTPFAQAAFNGPRGVAVDTGGNLFIADTDNHAIYYADFTKRQVQLLAGEPGMPGKVDGQGRTARFFRPTGIALSNDGRTIAVADTGNNVVRLVTRDGNVSTLGAASSTTGLISGLRAIEPAADIFDVPQSVSFDSRGNLYVVDKSGVQVVTNPLSQMLQVVSLAQPGTFVQAASVVVQGTEVFVLDAGVTNDAEAVKDVTVGAPEITSLSQDSDQLGGGAEVTLTGRNFAPESVVVLGDRVVNAKVVSATEIRFSVPPQNAPGNRTLSVQTRGGVAQRAFSIKAKSFQELANGEITTIAGGVSFLGDGGLATSATLTAPNGVTIDGAGNLFIADPLNNRIRRVDTSGVITTVAGSGTAGFSGDGNLAISASLDEPRGVAVDGAGNLLIADTKNNRIRRVDAMTGIITTVAGGGSSPPPNLGDGGPATSASLNFPTGLAIDRTGNLFIVDTNNNRIRRVDAVTGIITTVAGNGRFDFSGDNGPATNASLRLSNSFFFGGVAVDSAGNLFIADSGNNRIRRVDAMTGVITTVVGGGSPPPPGIGDGGPATSARLAFPTNISVDGAGNLFIADTFNNRIRRVDTSGVISTVAGNGKLDSNGDGGPATGAGLRLPTGMVVDGTNNLLIADTFNNRIRRVDATTKNITRVAGGGDSVFLGDGGPATSAGLNFPQGIALDGTGNLFIADEGNNRIRRVDATTDILTTVAGSVFSLPPNIGDGGPATSASLGLPRDVAVDAAGNLFIAEQFNNRIRRVDAVTGIITTVAGNGRSDFSGDGGPAINAGLNNPASVAVDTAGNLFIADTFNFRIRRVNLTTGIITTAAGNGNPGFGGDDGPATGASLELSIFGSGLAVDRSGNLFIVDSLNRRIRRVNLSTGIITTVAGNGRPGFSGDGGPATSAGLDFPADVAIDGAGNLFIADFLDSRVRRVDATTKTITTVAGNGTRAFSGDGGPATGAGLATPDGVAIDSAGNLFIADAFSNAIRVVKGMAEEQPKVVITSASFSKPNLIINGSGFGSSGARVSVNSQDVSARVTGQTNTMITLKGNKKKLNLRSGPNQLTVTANGVTSNTFVLVLP